MSKLIPKNVLEEIRAANDIVEVVGVYLQLKRAGSAFKTLCPFHKEKTPSFHVNPQRQIFHCFGCGAGGDVFKFIMQYENVDFSTAARMLAERVGIRVQWAEEEGGGPSKDSLYKLHEEVAQIYHRALLKSPSAARAREYIESRDLAGRTTEDFLIGYAPDQWDAIAKWAGKTGYDLPLLEAAGLVMRSDRGDPYDRFRNRLMFPIRDELGRVIAFSGRVLEPDPKAAKYVNSPDTALFRKGRVLYAMDRARRAILDARTAVLCEGQIDVIRCHVAGIHTAVAAQGTALTEDHARLIKRYADGVVLVMDADTAGQNAALRAAEVLLGQGLTVGIAALPEGEDPDSLIRRSGGDAMRQLIGAAAPLLDFQIAILQTRENASDSAAQLRTARAVLETIHRAPTAAQRDQLVQQAARALKLDAGALREDLAQLSRRRSGSPAPDAADPSPDRPAAHPAEEVMLAELLSFYPELGSLVRDHLPLEQLSDPACRVIIARLLEHDGSDRWNLAAKLAEEDDECKRLAAQIEATPPKFTGDECSPDEAAQDFILGVWRRALERRREECTRRLEEASGEQRTALQQERMRLTFDLQKLRTNWVQAQPVIKQHGPASKG
jgi:DNA primase